MYMFNTIRIASEVLVQEGIQSFLLKVYYYLKRKKLYSVWVKKKEQESSCEKKLDYQPLISVVVPIYNVKKVFLTECIESVLKQSYQNFELCLVDDCSTMKEVRDVLNHYANINKIKIVYRDKNGHISQATNSGLGIAKGEYVGLLDCDDILASNALYEIVKFLNKNKDYDYIYSDEDKITEDGKKRKEPFFKPDWSPDTVMSLMYTSHFSVYRKEIVDQLGGMRIGFEGAQDYDFVLRLMEKTDKIGHIPKILYHWRERKESTAYNINAKSYILESTIKAKSEALERRKLKGRLELLPNLMQYRVVYEVSFNPKVSIIILSKDNFNLLEKCINSIFKYTKYKNYEIILVDNGSNIENKKKYCSFLEKNNIEYFYRIMDFNFSKMCNMGSEKAKGDILLFLNDDIEICQDDWLERLIGQVQLEHVGAVGAKLLYPNSNRIQHSGILNLRTGPCHALYQKQDNAAFYFGRNKLDYNYCAITGACFMIDRKKFIKVGKFDENLAVTYNDVELCFRLIQNGYYNVLRNDVILLHHESISRGYDKKDEEKEINRKRSLQYLYQIHPKFIEYDPCYSYNLTQTRGDFSISIE